MKNKLIYTGSAAAIFLLVGAFLYSMRSLDRRTAAVVLQGFGDGLSGNQTVRLSILTLGRWLWLMLMPMAVYGYILYLYRINRELTVFRYGGYGRWYLEIIEMMLMTCVLFAVIMALWCGRKITASDTWCSVGLLALHLCMLMSIVTFLSIYFENTSAVVVAVTAVDVLGTQFSVNLRLPTAYTPMMWGMLARSNRMMEGGFDILPVICIQIAVILLLYIADVVCQRRSLFL